jgi:two-component system chemotaxis response regulator CheY
VTKTIMIVDDSASMRQVVEMTLVDAGYQVLQASDGLVALAKLTGQKVHLIISDVNMPNMDGLAFLKAVRLLPSCKFTPFIMLTTETAVSLKSQGRSAGAQGWMVKPFKAEQLLEVVKKLCLP